LPGLYNFEEIGYPYTFVGFTTASAMLTSWPWHLEDQQAL